MRGRWRAGIVLAALAAALAGCAGIEQAGISVPAAHVQPSANHLAEAGREAILLPLAPGAQSASMAREAPAAGVVMSTVSPARPEARTAPAGDNAAAMTFDVIPVYWGTDRKLPAAPPARTPLLPGAPTVTSSIDKLALPGGERGDRLVTGRSHITIPRIARDKGSIQRPRLYTVLNTKLYGEREDPRKHFTLGSFESMDRSQLARAANDDLAKALRSPGQALVFVHGYNSTFEIALFRAAQLAHDLEFDGVTYLYSWPSKGVESGYLYDRDSADRAPRFFLELLEHIARDTRVQKVHLIAHSLGNRPLLEGLKAAGNSGRLARRLKIDQVVLAAPDIDRDLFVEIARALEGASRGITLYASSNDLALKVSRTAARGVPRAGDVPPGGPVVVPGVYSIDISAAGYGGLLSINHNTYAEGGHVLADLRLLLRDGIHPPDRRFAVYRPMPSATGTWWKYVRN